MKSTSISCVAACATQKDVRIFSGMLKASDLIKATTVDYYNSELSPEDPQQGYQRTPERSRITKIGSYLIRSIIKKDGPGDGLFPSAVTLSARHPLKYDPETNMLEIRTDQKLQLVDGQHRVAGLRYVIEEKGREELTDYPIPFVAIETPDRFVEMDQFRIINGTAKSVRTDLVNSLITAISSSRGDEYVAEKDRWRVVVTKVLNRIVKDENSVWYNLILMPDEKGSPKSNDGKVIRATSFMTSLKPVYVWLKQMGFLDGKETLDDEAEAMFRIVNAYWSALGRAVPGAFDDPEQFVIQKTPGIFSLHKLLVSLLPKMFHGRRDWTEENFYDFISDSPEITDLHFWDKNAQRASAYGSMKGFEELFRLLNDSIEPETLRL